MNVQLPDGRVINDVPEGTTKAQLAEKLKANGIDVPADWLPKEPSLVDKAVGIAKKYVVDPAIGTLEAGTALTTGALAGTAGLATGVAGMVLPGPSGQGQDYMNRVQQAGTYQPQTPAGQRLTGIATAPFQKLGEWSQDAGKAVADATGSPTAGAVTQSTVQMAPALVSGGLKAAAPIVQDAIASQAQNARAAASRSSVKTDTFNAGQQEGYVVPPSAMGGGFISKRLESMGGKAAVAQEASIRNQEVTNKIARREAGLQPDDPISETTLAAARDNLAAPYQEVAQVSTRAAAALDKLQQVRSDSKTYWRHYGVSADPTSLKQAQALDNQAAMLERLIEKEATRAGKPGLVDDLREARVGIAKNYAVDRALNVGSGDVDARAIGRQLDKGQPLTGGLETIGRFAEAFNPYVREATRVPTPGVSKSEALTSLMLGAGGAAATGGPGVMLAAAPLLSGPTRSLVLSRLMQPSVGLRPYSQGVGLSAAENLTDAGITDPAAIIAVSEAKRKGLGL